MADVRSLRAKKNIAASLLCQLTVLLCGMVVPRMMIGAFGSEAYGAVSSITQFLAYVTLLEGGVGGVARAVLYEPLAKGDLKAVSAIMAEVRRFFRIIGRIVGIYVLVLACSFRSISRLEVLDWSTSFLLVAVISISSVGQYFIGISDSILLQAAQKSYITNYLNIGTTVLNALATVVLILRGSGLITVKLVSSLIFFLRPVALWAYARKHYPRQEVPRGKEEKYLTQKWTGLGQHLAYFLHTNTDIAVLTLLTNLKTVAVYAVYNMIVSHLQSLAVSFSSGMESLFGDMLARGEYRLLEQRFRRYESVLSVVSVTLFATAAVLLIPFLKLYTAGITDGAYLQPGFGLLLVLTALSYCLRLPYHALVTAAGHFRQTRSAAYGEALLNIGLSVVLVGKFGLCGVAAATLVATWFRFIYYVYYLSRNILRRKPGMFGKRLAVNAAGFGLSCLCGRYVLLAMNTADYFRWAVCGAVLVVLLGALNLGLCLLFFPVDKAEKVPVTLQKVREIL